MEKVRYTSIENVLAKDEQAYAWFVQDYITFVSGLPRPLVALHKKALGKQAHTVTGEFRYWVWEWVDHFILVSERRGIVFEVTGGDSRI